LVNGATRGSLVSWTVAISSRSRFSAWVRVMPSWVPGCLTREIVPALDPVLVAQRYAGEARPRFAGTP
jgi:hypothetical protein